MYLSHLEYTNPGQASELDSEVTPNHRGVPRVPIETVIDPEASSDQNPTARGAHRIRLRSLVEKVKHPRR